MQHLFSKIDKLFFVFCFLPVFQAQAASVVMTTHQLNWQKHDNYLFRNKIYAKFTTFPEAIFHKKDLITSIPEYRASVKISGNKIIAVRLNPLKTEKLRASDFQDANLLQQDFTVEFDLTFNRSEPEALVRVIPAKRNGGNEVELLQSFEIIVEYESGTAQNIFGKKATFVPNSVLATGEWLRVGVVSTGVHILNKGFFRNAGINPDNINPKTIKIYGMGAGIIPQKIRETVYDDLQQLSITVTGEADGVFNDADVVLFYGQSQKSVWRYNYSTGYYSHENNIYADTTYYFITYGGAEGKRVQTQVSAGASNFQSAGFDVLYYYERDNLNLIKSGRVWLGEDFDNTTTRTFSVGLHPVNTSEQAVFTSSVVARSFVQSNFSVSVNGANVLTHSVAPVSGKYDDPYASSYDGIKRANFNIPASNFSVTYNYNQPVPGSVGWLDYFEIQARGLSQMNGNQLRFSDAKSIAPNRVTEFRIANAANLTAWDITDQLNPQAMQTTNNGNALTFTASTDSLKTFLVFNNNGFLTPVSARKISNQNLHALNAADLVIITHPQFANEANTLANFHRNKSNLAVHVVNVFDIYNEFSSGSQDVSAIRDFLRMMYVKYLATPHSLKYVTLFGRASYDYKYRIANNTNFIPTFESRNSISPVGSYNTDDFFGLLDSNEGKWETNEDAITDEKLDVSIGRLPAQDNAQAAAMVYKIMQYANKADAGDWCSRLVFVADDEDGGLHSGQADGLANFAINNFKNYNVKKIYIDAYREELGTGGQRNPAAQEEIVRSVEKGALIINYTGHGGEVGWAEERILNTDDINGWKNGFKLPIFFTATCEFSRFDDPARASAGEMALLNPNGGGIALFTTVRLVNSGDNWSLNTHFYNNVGLDSASMQNPKPMGEIMRLTKNAYMSVNTRNFTLLGDPVITLSIPKGVVKTTAINSKPVSVPDTLSAFQQVEVSGIVTDNAGNTQTNFNGIIYPTVFDKPTNYRTIGQATPVQNFVMQNNVIYRGQVSVKNGVFSYRFIVPKDNAYEIGKGKMSYYALSQGNDAIGAFTDFYVGGTADSFAADNVGPEMKLFLNDEKFVFGGLTDENPLLIAQISDESGINITGKGIGRDISLVLNGKTDKTISLNDYFQGKLDDFTKGEVRYQLKDLEAGTHKLVLKAFDSYNNSSESMIEFTVASSEKMAIKNVLNYPNPFTTQTTFHFDHNKAGQPISVMIQLFTLSGKLIKTLNTETTPAGNHFDNIMWDGKDEYGDAIAKGVYVYKVKVRTSTGEIAEAYQKLVILN